MVSMDDLTLKIPELWKTDWKEIVDDSEGSAKQLLTFMARGAYLLKDINDLSVTPERLAWLSIWSKTYSVLSSALTALNRNSGYLLMILSRIATEMLLHTSAIMKKILSIDELRSSNYRTKILATSEVEAWKDVEESLCAYAAWGLWNDWQLTREILDPKNLDQAWDPNPVHEIVKDPHERQAFEAIFGPLEVETKNELLVHRRNQEQILRKKEKRIQYWLSHQRLTIWFDKLQNEKDLSFLELVDENEKTIRRQMKKFGIGFGYSLYREATMVVHGSTLEQFYHVSGTHLTPLVVKLKENAESKALNVAGNCNLILVSLYRMRERLWPA